MEKGNIQVGTQTDPVALKSTDDEKASLLASIESLPQNDDLTNYSPEKSKTPMKQNNGSPFNRADTNLGNTVANYQKADALTGGLDYHFLQELHMRLNNLFSRIKKQSKIKETKEKDL
jgi:hypothetical protein